MFSFTKKEELIDPMVLRPPCLPVKWPRLASWHPLQRPPFTPCSTAPLISLPRRGAGPEPCLLLRWAPSCGGLRGDPLLVWTLARLAPGWQTHTHTHTHRTPCPWQICAWMVKEGWWGGWQGGCGFVFDKTSRDLVKSKTQLRLIFVLVPLIWNFEYVCTVGLWFL